MELVSQWLAAVFTHPDAVGLLIIAAKTALIYVFLVVGLRVLGRRELGQMTIYDLVLIVVLANSVQNAMVGDDTTLAGGLVSAATLLAINRLFSFLLARFPWLESDLVGEPLLIISEGQLNEAAIRKEGVTRDQVMEALREHGLNKLDDARLGVLEVDGTISIVPKDATIHRTRHRFRAVRVA